MDRKGDKLIFDEIEVKYGQPIVRREMAVFEADIALQALARAGNFLQEEFIRLSASANHSNLAARRELEAHRNRLRVSQEQIRTVMKQEELGDEFQKFLSEQPSD